MAPPDGARGTAGAPLCRFGSPPAASGSSPVPRMPQLHVVFAEHTAAPPLPHTPTAASPPAARSLLSGSASNRTGTTCGLQSRQMHPSPATATSALRSCAHRRLCRRWLDCRKVKVRQPLHHSVRLRRQHVPWQRGAHRHRKAARCLGGLQAVDCRGSRTDASAVGLWTGPVVKRGTKGRSRAALEHARAPTAQPSSSPASSTTSACEASVQPRRRSVSRYTSGAGLPRCTYLADTICGCRRCRGDAGRCGGAGR